MINKKIILFLLFAYLFRLLFGLLLYGNPSDDILTYVIGLKYYCTGEWPYFGPGVGGNETDFVTRIPGALEGFVIGGCLKILPFAESPFILLNILSMGAICLLAWYCYKRFPGFSFFWLLAYMLFIPWELYLTTDINNASFILFGSVMFFIGFFESIKELSLGIIHLNLCYVMMGFSLFWVMQFHLSWFFFIPFLFTTFLISIIRDWKKAFWGVLFFILGAIPTASLLVPTLLNFGAERVVSGKGFGQLFDLRNFHLSLIILQRYISIANYEVDYFWDFFKENLTGFFGISPLYSFYYVLSYILKYVAKFQVLILIYLWFIKDHPRPGWKEFKYLALLFYLFIWISFWFTVKWPLTHIYHISYPVIMIYSLYCWYRFVDKKKFVLAAKIIIIIGIVFQTSFLLIRRHDYIYKLRPELQMAINQKDYKIFSNDLTVPLN